MRASVALLAAALLGATPARALDLEKAPTVPSLEPCPSKGPGFVRLPGSRTCTRLSGRVMAGADLRTGQRPGNTGSAVAPGAAGRFAIDNRIASDLGEVRTYVRIGNGRR